MIFTANNLLLAGQLSPGLVIFLVVLNILMLGGLAVFALFFYRGYEKLAKGSLKECFAGLDISTYVRQGDVVIQYRTYHGLIAWVTTIQHVVALPPDDAEILMGRLLRFNLAWGLITGVSLFGLPFYFANYREQMKLIADQAQNGPLPQFLPSRDFRSQVQRIAHKPSLIVRMGGWFCALLCPVFAITAVAGLIQGDYKVGIGGIVATILFGWFAHGFLTEQGGT